MKIVVVGGGVVGESLCSELSKEGNDVILIEREEAVLNRIIEKNDITGLVGNGASYENLVEAGVDKNTEIFIAVTEADELNIISCIVAKKLGAKYTIARIRNPEYNMNVKFVREDLGISLMINPEDEAAKNIRNKLKFPNAVSVEAFFSNRVNIIELEISDENRLIGMELKNISNITKEKVIICAVKRNSETFIPRGDFRFERDDRIYVTGSTEAIADFYNKMGYSNEKINSIMIIGGGMISHYLVEKLLRGKKQIKVIDSSEKRTEKLSQKYPEAVIIRGRETDQELLIKEGIGNHDAVVSLTDNDEENIVISMFARNKNKGKVLTKVDSTLFLSILDENKLSSIIVPKKIISDIILRAVRAKLNVAKSSKINALKRFNDTDVEAAVFEITKENRAIEVPLKDLKVIPNFLIACISRNHELIYPGGNDVLKENDKVMIVTTKKGIENFDDGLV